MSNIKKEDDYFFIYYKHLTHISPKVNEMMVAALKRRIKKIQDSLEPL